MSMQLPKSLCWASFRGIAACALFVIAVAAQAAAQIAGGDERIEPPIFQMVDRNGINFAGGDQMFQVKEPSISIGNPQNGGLYFQRTRYGSGDPYQPRRAWGTSNLLGSASGGPICPTCTIYYQYAPWTYWYSVGGHSDKFVEIRSPTSSELVPVSPSGASISGPNFSTYTASDGTRYQFNQYAGSVNLVTRAEKPDGEIIEWHYAIYYRLDPQFPPLGAEEMPRLQSVTNNLGYEIHFEYESDIAWGTDTGVLSWRQLKRVIAIDTSVYACGALDYVCSPTGGGVTWPRLEYSTDPSNAAIDMVTDSLGRLTRYYYDGPGGTLSAARSPAVPTNDMTFTTSMFTPEVVTVEVTNSSGHWVYGGTSYPGGTVTVTGPNGYSRQITFGDGPSTGQYADWMATYNIDRTASILERFVASDTENGRTTNYEYDPQLRISKISHSDGRSMEYSYNSHGSATQLKYSGLGVADTYVRAEYPESGATFCTDAVRCNKPTWTRDPLGNQSDFVYDASHGGLLAVTSPAPGSGPYSSIRPQTRYAYSDNGTGIVRLQSVSTCATTGSCAGTADEMVVQTNYDTHRRPSKVITRAGDLGVAIGSDCPLDTRCQQTTTTYTPVGDVATIDGPMSGTGDTTYMFYDAMRQLRATVTPNPGNGSLPWRVTRTEYNGDGNPTTVRKGAVSTPSACSSGSSFCAGMADILRTDFSYDSYGRKTREDLIDVSNGSPALVTQTSYDSAGRIECVARRMNSAVYGSLPGACTQSTIGSFGPDRIVHTTYTASGDVDTIQSGYGTALVRNERAMTYLAPGQIGTLRDAANNLTTYEYDGFNRLKRVRYPNPNTTNSSSSSNGEDLTYNASSNSCTLVGGPSLGADYEGFAYDAAGNKTCERRRDGLAITNTYDSLNRLAFIDRPGSEPDISNSYNTQKLIEIADGTRYVKWTYDALGRLVSEEQSELNTTVSHTYDPGGRWAKLTWPDNFWVEYDLSDAGETYAAREYGATSGPGYLAYFSYDDVGRPKDISRGESAMGHTGFGYDSASRLAALGHDGTTGGGSTNQFFQFTYNPAGQVTSRTASNTAYNWPYSTSFNDSYAVNGLNQYTSARGFSISHDGRGNGPVS